MMRWAWALAPLAWGLWVGTLATAQEPPTPPPVSPLQQCAALCDLTERLVCYDRLAAQERTPPGPAASSGSGSASAGVAATVSVPPRTATSPAAAQPASKESFGLYAAEHPAPPPPPKSLSALIVGIGAGPDGRSTVELEGGQTWLLVDEQDPLLAKGDSVIIERAAFGSFLMRTKKGRTHRVVRMR